MKSSEIIDFLLPQFGDPIQIVFFSVIMLMMVYTIAGAHYSARPSEWEKKWNRGTEKTKDDLDIDHGSVTDLWHAVATAHEKLAEIMPGLLLVVGLLGTFLGLGLALNHASNILGQQDAMSAAGAANSMSELMGMLNGLGTKFKTSTWGICGFVLLKIWSELTRFEEKRLLWVSDKVKKELRTRRYKELRARRYGERARRNFEKELEAAKQKALFEEIRAAAGIIEKSLHTAIQAAASDNQAFLGERIASLNDLLTNIRAIGKASNDSLIKIHSSTNETSNSMAAFTENTAKIVDKMAEAANGMDTAAKGMASGAKDVSVAASGLSGAVGNFSNQFEDVLKQVGEDLDSTIQEMSKESAKTMASGSQKLEDATNKISTALDSLSVDIKNTLGEVKVSIKDSLDIQNRAFTIFDSTSKTLEKNIEHSTQIAKTTKESIEDGLRGVSNASRNVGVLSKQIVVVAKKLGKDTFEEVESLSKEHEVISADIEMLAAGRDRMASEEKQTSLSEAEIGS